MLALRIGTVKNSKNFFRVDGPARSMRIGAGKVWGDNNGKFGVRHWPSETTLKGPLLTSHKRGYVG